MQKNLNRKLHNRFFYYLEMEIEIKPEGRNFRMVSDDELPKILETLEKYLPYSMKVRWTMSKNKLIKINFFIDNWWRPAINKFIIFINFGSHTR